MEKRDAAVALVGGIILLVALAGAGYSSRFEEGAPFLVTYVTDPLAIDSGNRGYFGVTGFEEVFAFDVTEPNLTALHVNVTLSYLSSGSDAQGSLHARLLGPNNLSVAGEAVAPAGARSGATIPLVIALAPLPDPSVVRAASAEAAVTAAGAPEASGVGAWRLEVSFSSGLAPAGSATLSWEATANHWRAVASPAPEDGR